MASPSKYRYRPPDWWRAERGRRQWPLEPLLEWINSKPERVLKVSGSEIAIARVEGLTDFQADRWACRVGAHPCQVWPDWFERGLHPLDELHVYGSATAEPGWRQAALWKVA